MNLQRMFSTTLNSPVARAFVASTLITLPGCAVPPQASTPAASQHDSAITTLVREKFERNTTVDEDAIDVVTRNSVVMLSGVARSTTERTMAETLARSVSGVKSVTNTIVVRP